MLRVLILAVLVCLTASAMSQAALSSTMHSNGSGGYATTDTSGGMTAINALAGSLNWTVDKLSSGLWKYTYTITPVEANKNRGIGSFNIQFGQQPTDLIWSYTYSGSFASTMGAATTNGVLQTIDRTLAGSTPTYTYNSWLDATNPNGTRVNVTKTFQGLQWVVNQTNPNGSNYVKLELTTALAPMWGNIYMDGYNMTSNNGYGFMRNTNYDSTAPQPFSLSGPVQTGYLPVPGSYAAAVPALGLPLVFVLASGMAAILFLRGRAEEAIRCNGGRAERNLWGGA